MSTFGGIHNLDGAPIYKELLTDLGTLLEARGPDGGREVYSTSVGMTYRALSLNISRSWRGMEDSTIVKN
jgi:hypothetical protein